MNLTRSQLIKHCHDAINANKYLLVRYNGYSAGLNPSLAKFVKAAGNAVNVAVVLEIFNAINEYEKILP